MSTDGQKLLIKMHTYRITGVVFAILGVFIFAAAYTNLADGSFLKLFQEPSLIIWLISPFLPSSLLFWMYGRAEKKLARLLEQTEKSA
jgi:hypothetical protein